MRKVLPRQAYLIPEQAERVFKGIIFDVYQWKQKLFDGREVVFEMLRRPDTIKVIAIKDNKIVVIDEEQPHYGSAYELPGGRNDVESEDELACAKRELLEETGMVFKTWKLLDVRQRQHKIEAFVYVFLAIDFVSQTEKKLDGGEKNSVHLMTIEECIETGKMSKGKSLPTKMLKRARTIGGLLALPEYR